jgi:glycosyltransferase involved in cell wall biosynthesis
MKNRIALDARMIRKTGIGTYVRGLLQGLGKLKVPGDLCIYGNTAELAGYPFPRRGFLSRIYSVEEQLEYPFRLPGCGLWHAPHYNVPVWSGDTKVVVTIHDIIHWLFRKEFFTPLKAFYADQMLRKAITQSRHILTVSEKTKKDLVDHFEADPEKITVTYEGVSEDFQPVTDAGKITGVKSKYKIANPYFIYVGLMKPHKNVLWLIRLFRELRSAGQITADLVLVGKKDASYPPEYKELAGLKSGDGIIHIPYVEFEELKTLYSGALALVHPSLYEGFGLTLLEAMACGTPVIACRSGSIPEVAGDAACLVEACAPREIAHAMARFASSPGARQDYIRKGFLQVGRFSWTKMAEQTLEVYERVLAEK